MKILISTVLVSAISVQGLIPEKYPKSEDWLEAVGTEVRHNRVFRAAFESEQQVEKVWLQLGGNEMAHLCLTEGAPTGAVLGTFLLAGELASAGFELPATIATAMTPLCTKMHQLSEVLVNAVSHLLHLLRRARRYLDSPLTMDRVITFTPLAHMHLVCGGSFSSVPHVAQAMIKSAIQRELNNYAATEAPPLPEQMPYLEAYLEATRIVGHYPRDRLVSGAIETNHLQVLFDAMFRPMGIADSLFDETDGLHYLTPVELGDRDKVGKTKYFIAGRVLALSILYGVPIGRKLDQKLVDILCGRVDEAALLEFQMLQSGFQDIVPIELLNNLMIDSETVGKIIAGMDSHFLSPQMVISYMVSNFDEEQMESFFAALDQSPENAQLFVLFATGLAAVPVGGLAAVTPPISVSTDESSRIVIANRNDHTVTMPVGDMGAKLIRALEDL